MGNAARVPGAGKRVNSNDEDDMAKDDGGVLLIPRLQRDVSDKERIIVELTNELEETRLELSSVKQELHQLQCVVQEKLQQRPANDLPEKNTSLLSPDSARENSQAPSIEVSAASRNKRIAVSAESGRESKEVQIELKRYPKDTRAKELIASAISKNNFLKHLEKPQIREIVDCMFLETFPVDSKVITENDSGSAVYVLGDGSLQVSKDGALLGRPMQPGTLFGELAILYNCTRTATVQVVEEASIWTLQRNIFQQIMQRTGMLRRDEDMKFLKSVPLLKNLSETLMYKIVDVLEEDFYYTDQYIVREGQVGDTFFLIKTGTVKVFQQVTGESSPKEIRSLSCGDYFGEKALLDNGDVRTASIIAQDPGVQCLVIDQGTFLNVIGSLNVLKEKDYGDEQRGALNTTSNAVKNSSIKSPIGVSTAIVPPTQPMKAMVAKEFVDCTLNDFKVLTTLGMGGFGRVELVQDNRYTKKTYALKCLGKSYIVETQQQQHTFNEKEILMALNSDFIVRLHQTFRDNKYVYLLMEVCLGGELWTILRDRDFFNEPTAKFYTACVVEAFDYLHSKGIIYRDLKPENLLVDDFGYAKMVDFGFAKRIGNGKKTWTFCGTPEYVAPEIILNKGHDLSADYWSLGILVFELMTGNPPFSSKDAMKTYTMTLRGIDSLEFPSRITKTAQHFIKKLCRDLPSERLGTQKDGVNGIRRHKWFQGFHWKGLANRTLQAPFQPKIKHPTDCSNFDNFPDLDHLPPDETSNWDINF